MEALLKALNRRDFLNMYSKENLKHLVGAMQQFQEGVKEKSRRSCDEVGLNLFKKRFHQHPK